MSQSRAVCAIEGEIYDGIHEVIVLLKKLPEPAVDAPARQ